MGNSFDMTQAYRLLAIVAIASLAIHGCGRDRDARRTEPGERLETADRPAGGRINVFNEQISLEEATAVVGAQSAAVLAITSALCNRADHCKQLGETGSHASREHCFRDTGKEWMGRLNGPPCERGIDLGLLEACLDSIRSDKCQNPLDTLARLAACEPSVFCNEP